jgi:hypothetical protein
MSKIVLSLCLFLFLAATGVTARGSCDSQSEKVATINSYLSALQGADLAKMNSLLGKDAVVYSTSKGKVAAGTFFQGFFPEIMTAKVSDIKIFKQREGAYGAMFNFSWTEKDGKQYQGYYMDEFEFDKSGKLTTVRMFENKYM